MFKQLWWRILWNIKYKLSTMWYFVFKLCFKYQQQLYKLLLRIVFYGFRQLLRKLHNFLLKWILFNDIINLFGLFIIMSYMSIRIKFILHFLWFGFIFYLIIRLMFIQLWYRLLCFIIKLLWMFVYMSNLFSKWNNIMYIMCLKPIFNCRFGNMLFKLSGWIFWIFIYNLFSMCVIMSYLLKFKYLVYFMYFQFILYFGIRNLFIYLFVRLLRVIIRLFSM